MGVQNCTANHLDRKDTKTALWLALGRAYYISIPEFERLVLLRSGDLVTFDASKLLHSLVAPAPLCPDEACDIHCCVSLYTNNNQLYEVAKMSTDGKPESLSFKKKQDTNEDDSVPISAHEELRKINIARNNAMLAQPGLGSGCAQGLLLG